MEKEIRGVHHVTAITSDPQANLDFYAGVLGLRFVKKTVNFDDPRSYHLYYGDEGGRPGTIMTFFAWPGARRGRIGAGQVTVTSFSVPPESVGWWIERLRDHGVEPDPARTRFDEEVLACTDPDGLRLELVAPGVPDPRPAREDGPVPPEHAVRGFHAVTLEVPGHDATAGLLTATMGFEEVAGDGERLRLAAARASDARVVDLLERPRSAPGEVAAGTVHHVAWRTPDDPQQLAWREELQGAGFEVTPVMDRHYFHSIYFREPGGVLFEIATDPPGFTVDEPPEELGSGLRLPPWMEPRRSEIERALPPVSPPGEPR